MEEAAVGGVGNGAEGAADYADKAYSAAQLDACATIQRLERGRVARKQWLVVAEKEKRGRKAPRKTIKQYVSQASIQGTITSDSAARIIAKRAIDNKLSWRERVTLILTEPGSGRLAFVFACCLWATLIVWGFAWCIESWPNVVDASGPAVFIAVSFLTNCLFTFEVTIRIAAFVPSSRRAFVDPLVLIDLLACAPFWCRVALFPQSLTAAEYFDHSLRGTALGFFQSLACFRLLKLCRYLKAAWLLRDAIVIACMRLVVPLFLMFILVFCFAAIIFELEWDRELHACSQLWAAEGITREFRQAWPGGVSWDCSVCDGLDGGSPSLATSTEQQMCAVCAGAPAGHPECQGVAFEQNFANIPYAMWFMFVTMTTVGYGDVYPSSPIGKMFAAGVIICGVLFLALPISIVGSSFAQVWEDRELRVLKRHMTQMLAHKGIGPSDVFTAFNQVDKDGDGEIDASEFMYFCQKILKLPIPKNALRKIWAAVDFSKDGSIEFVEFAQICFPELSEDQVKLSATRQHVVQRQRLQAEKRLQVEQSMLVSREASLRGGDAHDGSEAAMLLGANGSGSAFGMGGQLPREPGCAAEEAGSSQLLDKLAYLALQQEKLQCCVEALSAQLSATSLALGARLDASSARLSAVEEVLEGCARRSVIGEQPLRCHTLAPIEARLDELPQVRQKPRRARSRRDCAKDCTGYLSVASPNGIATVKPDSGDATPTPDALHSGHRRSFLEDRRMSGHIKECPEPIRRPSGASLQPADDLEA